MHMSIAARSTSSSRCMPGPGGVGRLDEGGAEVLDRAGGDDGEVLERGELLVAPPLERLDVAQRRCRERA